MRKLSMMATTVTAATLLGLAGAGVVSADSAKSGNVGTSGIPRTVFMQERLDAVAQVLGTSTSNVQAAHKNKSFKQLVSNAGLTKATFSQKVKAQLTTDLESKGYSQSQVTIALQHRNIVHLRHELKQDKN